MITIIISVSAGVIMGMILSAFLSKSRDDFEYESRYHDLCLELQELKMRLGKSEIEKQHHIFLLNEAKKALSAK